MRIILTFLFSILFSIASFAQNEKADTTVNYAVNDTINDAKVIQFGKALEAALYDGDHAYFMKHFDVDEFSKKVMLSEEETSDNKKLKKFNETFGKGFFSKFDMLPKKIIDDIKNNGSSCDIVNYYYSEYENKYHLLFRVFSEGSGINYHDYQLSYKNNEFLIEDLYIYTTGEYFSETLKQLYLSSIPQSFFSDSEKNKSTVANLLVILRYKRLIKDREFKKAYKLLSDIKSDLKDQKLIYILKIQTASNINDIYYMEAIDELLKKFPDDPSTKLMAIDYYIMLKDYNGVMTSLKALRDATEDDFLEYLKGTTAWEFQDFETAEASYKYVVKEYPNFITAKINFLYLLDELKKYEDCISLLDSLITDEYYTKEDLVSYIDDDENEFINLPKADVYIQWKKEK